MNFATLINTKIMPAVNNDSDDPIIIYRDSYGDWHGEYTHNQYGEEFEWADDVRENNPFAVTVKGSDFDNKNYLDVYDKIFLEVIEMEYNYFYDDGTFGENYSLLSFVQDNIGDFTDEVARSQQGNCQYDYQRDCNKIFHCEFLRYF